ncbi:MAG: hypothetical protein DRO40_05355 [Thermoprotei archaeon]|nr:MAG: hypothetical protein DRO40_05355 [Thermoprotei archaeon]
MSSLGASALRHLEKLIDKIKRGTRVISKSPSKLLEYIMAGIVRAGDRIENGLVQRIRLFARYMLRFQRSLFESVLLASLWAGLLFTIALLIIAILNVLG